MSEEIISENVELQGIIDDVCLIWNKWNRKETSSDIAIREIGRYINLQVQGALKRRELLKKSILLSRRTVVQKKNNKELDK